MAQAVPLAELERRLQVALTSPGPGRRQVHLQAALVRGHEAAIRLVDAGNYYVCLCCPAQLHNNGMLKTGPAFRNVLCHIYGRQHAACAARWVKVKYLMRRLRLFARMAGRVLLYQWRARAAERIYAPGGLGFKEARADFKAHASIGM